MVFLFTVIYLDVFNVVGSAVFTLDGVYLSFCYFLKTSLLQINFSKIRWFVLNSGDFLQYC